MCGIAGFLLSNNLFEEGNQVEVLKRMTEALKHRGPDDSGYWIDPINKIALGHRRLSVIDLTESGHQPMVSHSGKYVLAFNGEIYNHLRLRNELNNYSTKPPWRGTSDTETLLACFERWGVESSLKRCEGMFSFALWCKGTNTLVLGRDRLGEKPLYYGWQGSGSSRSFLFSSELKSFKEHDSFEERINRDSLSLYMRYNCVPSPFSIYDGIFKLPAGKILTLSLNNPEPKLKTYWSGLEAALDGSSSGYQWKESEAIDHLESLLKDSIKDQMISDVPLGAFLSGGVDSSTIVALMQAQSKKSIKTFSIGFHEEEKNEAHHAKLVADFLKTDHSELYVTPQDALEVIPSIPYIYDEPFSDSSQIPTYLISKLARESVTVSLTGDGGDELFGGYNRYLITKNLWPFLGKVPLKIRNTASNLLLKFSTEDWDSFRGYFKNQDEINSFGEKIHKGARVLNAKSIDDLYLKLTSHWSNPDSVVKDGKEPQGFLNNHINLLSEVDDIQRMMILDMLTYLPNDILTKVDRAAMAVSLETRVPFLNHKVVEFSCSLPLSLKIKKGVSKWILRQVLYKYVPKNLIERPKSGFSVPINSWLKGSLKDWAEDLLDENTMKGEGFFNPEIIRTKWNEHLTGKRNWDHHLWDVLMFQSWLRK